MAIVIGLLLGIVIVVLGIDWMIKDSSIKAYKRNFKLHYSAGF